MCKTSSGSLQHLHIYSCHMETPISTTSRYIIGVRRQLSHCCCFSCSTPLNLRVAGELNLQFYKPGSCKHFEFTQSHSIRVL